MIKSMTGYSKSESTENGIKATVEVKSLNGRFLDVNLRTPRSLHSKEIQLREIIKAGISRGSISLNVNFEYAGLAKPFSINQDAAKSVYKELTELKKKLKLRDAVKIEHVLEFSSFFNEKDESEETAVEWRITKKSLSKALANLDKMRQKEGQEIFKDFNIRLRKITTAVDNVEKMSAKRIIDEREKIRLKVAKLFESDEIDETRIQMEIVLIANRLDVSEECVRLRSHLKFFRETCKLNEPKGQKLNFLLQEMNREINTIGSKSDSAEISHIVVNVKEELERIREQVQNVE